MAIKNKEKKGLNWTKNLDLSPSDDLFGKLSSDGTNQKVVAIPLAELAPYHNNAYQVRDDEEMAELIDSIKENGILDPLFVRPYKGKYEVVAGNRRLHAAQKAGLTSAPCIIKDIDDDTADIFMNQYNKYRQNILPSEKALGYKAEYDARKRIGKVEGDIYNVLGEGTTDSKATIIRYLRLSSLSKKLLDLVDEGRLIKIAQGVSLSFLSEKEQTLVYDVLVSLNKPLNMKQADKIKAKHDSHSEITKDFLENLISGEKKVRVAPKPTFSEKPFETFVPEIIKKQPIEKRISYHQAALKKFAEFIQQNPEEINKYLS